MPPTPHHSPLTTHSPPTATRVQGPGIGDRGLGGMTPTAHYSPLTTHSPNALRAFTLIELLVVISIIALLIGILLPALGAARDSARKTQCLTNVRSISQAINFYLADSREVFPAALDTTVDWWNAVGIAGTGGGSRALPEEDRILNSYLSGAAGVAKCPLDAGTSVAATKPTAFDHNGTSYLYPDRTNFTSGNHTFNDWWLIEGHRATEVIVPSRKALIAEESVLGPASRPGTSVNNQWHNKTEPLIISVAYLDGHAKEVKRNQAGGARVTNVAQTVIDQLSRNANEYY